MRKLLNAHRIGDAGNGRCGSEALDVLLEVLIGIITAKFRWRSTTFENFEDEEAVRSRRASANRTCKGWGRGWVQVGGYIRGCTGQVTLGEKGG